MTQSPFGRGREEQSGWGGREEQSGWGGREEQSGYPGYSGYSDPAYASQTPYGQSYQPPPAPHPTEHMPVYSPYGPDPYATGQYPPQPPGHGSEPPPEGPKSPRWLWIVAGVAVLMVIGLVIALVIVNSSRQQTVVAPLPPAPEPAFTTPAPTTIPRTPTTRPTTPVLPVPTLPSSPPRTSPTAPRVPGATDNVVYTVDGNGRAINITYVDTGGLLQTEFNVMLPWSKEVALPQPGEDSASISIINVGREVTCSISLNGAQLDQRTGIGLTICTPRR